jgi:hypothetical protein
MRKSSENKKKKLSQTDIIYRNIIEEHRIIIYSTKDNERVVPKDARVVTSGGGCL